METEQTDLNIFWPDSNRRIDVSVYGYVFFDGSQSKIKAIMLKQSPEIKDLGLTEFEIKSFWTVPTADQMDTYRQQTSKYDPESRDFVVNKLSLRDFIISCHLKKIVIPPDSNPVDLQFKDDQLDFKTLSYLKRLHSGLYDTLYIKYLSESCLSI